MSSFCKLQLSTACPSFMHFVLHFLHNLADRQRGKKSSTKASGLSLYFNESDGDPYQNLMGCSLTDAQPLNLVIVLTKQQPAESVNVPPPWWTKDVFPYIKTYSTCPWVFALQWNIHKTPRCSKSKITTSMCFCVLAAICSQGLIAKQHIHIHLFTWTYWPWLPFNDASECTSFAPPPSVLSALASAAGWCVL